MILNEKVEKKNLVFFVNKYLLIYKMVFILIIFPVHLRNRRQSIECEDYEWQCFDKQCIDSKDVCNGVADCRDQSDERAPICQLFRCPSYSFRCSYGACVKGTAACDGIKDCIDGSDESNCQVKCE